MPSARISRGRKQTINLTIDPAVARPAPTSIVARKSSFASIHIAKNAAGIKMIDPQFSNKSIVDSVKVGKYSLEASGIAEKVSQIRHCVKVAAL